MHRQTVAEEMIYRFRSRGMAGSGIGGDGRLASLRLPVVRPTGRVASGASGRFEVRSASRVYPSAQQCDMADQHSNQSVASRGHALAVVVSEVMACTGPGAIVGKWPHLASVVVGVDVA